MQGTDNEVAELLVLGQVLPLEGGFRAIPKGEV
jgi:hypothetical protein